MNKTRVGLTLGIASMLMTAVPVFADDDAPRYDKGPVWSFGEIRTKDGHFDDYMKWVATEWKAQEEAMKKGGRILDYKVYVVADPRKDEPDIILAEEFKNMAEFDRPTSDEYAFAKHLYGSVSKANKEQADRGSLRTVLDAVVMREVTLK